MSVNKTWNGVTYSIPNTRSESGWESTLSSYLQALADNAATTTFNKQAVRKATTTPVTVSASTDCTIIVDLTGPGASTVNLPAGADKQIFVIVDGKGDASTNNITIDANGSETIEGSLTKVIRLNRECLVLQYSSSAGDWKVIGGYVPNMVGGPASSTDNAIARFDGTTGKLVQNSDCTISDAGAVTLGPGSFSGVHTLNGVVRCVVPGASTGGFRFSGSSSESHLQCLGTNASTNGSLSFYSYRSDLSNEILTGTVSAAGAWTLGPTTGTSAVTHVASAYTSGYGLDLNNRGGASFVSFSYIGSRKGAIGFGTSGGIRIENSAATNIASSDDAGAWTLGNTSVASGTQQTIYGSGTSGANALVVRNVNSTSGGDVIDIQTAATSGSVSAFTMTDGAGTLCGYCTIDTTANTVSYTNTSDARLKTNHRDFNGLELITQLSPTKFERISDPGKDEIGFVAQQVQPIFPQAVSVATDEFQTMGIDYSKFTPVLVKAIQEQQALIAALEARIAALENK